MSNIMQTMKGRISTFWRLYNEKAIYIPKIQRDYVQGRKSVQVISNRGEFVTQLINALENETPLMLNFIYGYNDENRFVPIDGQQRLTTLYLLHIYLAKVSGKSDQLKDQNFIYDTRYTTKTFFEKLIGWDQNEWNVETIKDMSWYSADWDNDQSIHSCCSMLQEIHQQMKGKTSDVYEQYFRMLTSETECPITFMLCDISDGVDKPNQLYIRMNARGKQLTALENFKADMYSYLDEKDRNIKQCLVGNMDGDWLDLLWNLEPDLAEKYCDVFYRELLHWIIVNRFTADKDLKVLLDWLEKGKDIDQIYFEEYKKFDEATLMDAFRDMHYTLNVLSEVSKDPPYFKELKNVFFRYMDDKRNKYSTPINTYPGRARLFAVAKFGRALSDEKQCFDRNKFKAWYRIMNNLISNAEINNVGDMQKVLEGIKEISNSIVLDVSQIAAAEKQLKDIPTFKKHIVEEEIFKQKIIDTDGKWKTRIEKAEKISFFSGEIRFIFNALDITDEHKISNQENNFDNVVKAVEAWIEKTKECTLLRLLYANMKTAEDCFYEESRFYVNVERHNNYDVRGLLREEKGVAALKSALDEMKASYANNPEDYAKGELDTSQLSLGGSPLEVFVRHLIYCPELIEFCEQGRFFKYGEKIYLIKGRYHQNMPEYISYVKFIKNPSLIKVNELPNAYSDTLSSHKYDYEKNGKQYKIEYQNEEYNPCELKNA
ncbi:MAG: DUF262 domain-containing protein [Clostridia bacterium]|nr:DUF262 domain-containing protein [Clostridia bacterium]